MKRNKLKEVEVSITRFTYTKNVSNQFERITDF